MALTYTYADAYLRTHVTEDREDRAAADVAEYGTFAAEWTERLVILRAYILTCLECQAQPDDLFASKLTNYRKEFDAVLAQARADTVDPDTGLSGVIFSIPMERA